MTPTGNWAAAGTATNDAGVAQLVERHLAKVEVAGLSPAPRFNRQPDALDLAAAIEEAAIDLYALAAGIRAGAYRLPQDIAFVAIRAKGEARAVHDNLSAVFSACIPQTMEASNGR